MEREEYRELELDSKVEMFRALVPLGLMHVHELVDDEVKALGRERYARKDDWECRLPPRKPRRKWTTVESNGMVARNQLSVNAVLFWQRTRVWQDRTRHDLNRANSL